MDPDRLLGALNASQREAVTTDGAPVVVHAGAGSGKTRVLTRRIAWRVAVGQTDPQRVLALTFTRKSAGELRSRLFQLGLREQVVAGTFHGVALMQLRRRWAERGVEPPTLVDRKYRMVSQLLGRRKGVEPLDVVAEIEWARARLVGPNDYAAAAQLAGRTPPIPPADMSEILEKYQQEKRRRRLVDFDDLLALAIRDIQSDPDYAASIRWRHRHLYVDEFQDVNPLQFELLRAWRGDTKDLFVVGDPNQAIYGWNGADPQLLQRFANREPGTTVITLTDNYRSSPQILMLANASLEGKGGQLVANQPDGPLPVITTYPTDAAEAAGIADAVVSAKTGAEPWAHQAVLVRTNAQLVPIEQALAALRVPVRVRGGTGPLGSQEVKDELRQMGRPGVRVEIALANLDTLLDNEPPEATQSELERRANLTALSRLVHEYLTIDMEPSGPNLMAWIATIQGSEVDNDRDAVELATFHSAKGLEWPVVHVAGLEKGYVPISYAKTGGQLAEEQRLLYVALTRAEKELRLSWASERTFGMKHVKRQGSPYLPTIESALDHLRRGYKPSDWRAGVATSRASLPKTVDRNPVADPVFDALRDWRRRRAKAADVPAYVIFNDKTLRAIAKVQPTSKSKLASVSGIGPAKLDRFGDEVINLVKENS